MSPWGAVSGWRCVAAIGAGLLVTVSFYLQGGAEPDWRRPSLDEFEVRVDEGAAEEAAFHKRFYRATRIEKRDVDAARKIYRELLAERPETAYLYFKLAQLDRRERRREPCIENFKTALKYDPKMRMAYDDLGRIYGWLDRDQELIELCEQAVEHIKPDNIKYYLKIGELHEKHGRAKEAIEVYERAIAEHPVLYRPWLRLFELQLDAGQDEEAYETYRKSLEATGGHRSLLVGVRDLYLEKHDEERAFELTKLLVERFPFNAGFWSDLVAGLLRKGETEQARAAFRKSCAYLHGERDYFAKIVRLYGECGDSDEAIAVFEYALECEPQSLEVLVALVVLYEARGETDKARPLHERLIELNPTDESSLLAIAEGCERQGQVEIFGDWARRAVDAHPDSFEARFALLRYYEQAGKRDEASRLLDQILDTLLGGKDPNPAPCIRIGAYYLEREEYQQVRDIAAKGLGATGYRPLVRRFYFLSGMADYSEHRIPDAARKLKIASRRKAELAEAHFYLGLCRLRLGRAEEAVSALECAVEQSPDNVWWRIKLGRALKLAGQEQGAQEQFDAAIGALERAVRASPDDVGTRLGLASTLNQIGRNEDAAREFKRALDLNPDSATALNGLGYMWAEEGKNLDEALKLIERALELEPESGAITDSLGWVHFKQGRTKEALHELERAVELAPPTAEIYDHLGDVHLKLGDKAKAVEWWNKALELYPENAAVIRKKVVEHGGKPATE